MKPGGFLKRTKGLRAVGTSDYDRAGRNLDDALSKMVRFDRDADLPCILCGQSKQEYENGHFVPRGMDMTRWHPMNCNKECHGCNNQHVSSMNPDKGFPYGLAIDARYGEGTAKFLWLLAYPKQEVGKMKPVPGWTVRELEGLKFAARMGPRVYEQTYFEMRPDHRPSE